MALEQRTKQCIYMPHSYIYVEDRELRSRSIASVEQQTHILCLAWRAPACLRLPLFLVLHFHFTSSHFRLIPAPTKTGNTMPSTIALKGGNAVCRPHSSLPSLPSSTEPKDV